jgi:methionine-rich copper-binding protein CopC
MKRIWATVLILIVFTPSQLLSASAHTALVESTPAAGEVLEEFPDRVELRFNEPLLNLGEDETNYFTLFSPAGEQLPLSALSVEGSLLSASVLDKRTEAGEYRIEYRVVAGDGHVIRGDITFTLTPQVGITEEREDQSEVGAPSQNEGDTSVLVLGILILITASLVVALLLRSGSDSREGSNQG